MNALKCPHCEKNIDHANITGMALHETGSSLKKYRGVAYTCPECKMILSVGFDPLALEANIKDQMIDLLRALKENRI